MYNDQIKWKNITWYHGQKAKSGWDMTNAIRLWITMSLSRVTCMTIKMNKTMTKKATIKGFVARDKDGTLRFCYHKPRRENAIEKTWWGSCDADFDIYNDTLEEPFADLTWENKPVEVELTINRL